MRHIAFILALGLCLCHSNSRSQTLTGPDDYNTRLWQMEDGLPNNIVQALAQTQDGYLWIGTREGLVRFDGINFQKVSLLAGHIPPSVSCLHQGRDGTLWIGTDGLGLFRRSAGRIQRCQEPDGKLDFDVREIHESGDGATWITSSGIAQEWVDGKIKKEIKLKRSLQGLCVGTNGTVWTVEGALIRLDAAAPTNYFPFAGALDFNARCLYCDAAGTFWMGNGDNLVELKSGAVTTHEQPGHPSGYISVIFRDSLGQLWVGSYLGLSRFAHGKFFSHADSDAPQYRIYAIFEDREKNLWIGSEEGLLRLTPKIFRTFTKRDGLSANTVVSVCATQDGSVWINPWGCGLNHWTNGKITTLTETNGLSSNYIMAMTEGRDGSLWAGADNGHALNHLVHGHITTYDARQGFVMSPSTATTALFEDEHRRLWIGSRELLQCWDGIHFQQFSTNNGLSNPKINAICGGASGIVWIGTEGGLTEWRDGTFMNLAATNASLCEPILSLYEDPEHGLWIGSRGGGLLEFKDGRVHEFTSSQGLLSDTIYAILEDGHDNLWLNSSLGIFRLDKRQLQAVADGRKNTVTSVSYGKADGILSSGQYQEVTQPSACKSSDGRLWFRTTQGVAVVNPDKLEINKLAPPVMIQEVLADRHPVGNPLSTLEMDRQIVIPPGHGELEVHFAALSFRAPEKNRFRYKLDGVDLNWVEAGTRQTAFYNNLRPGHYHFQVTACNNDGVWNDSGATVALILEPHFWQTWWFLACTCLCAVGVVSGTARYITRQRMQMKLQKLERQNVIERERTRIARDLHDELGAKLTRISFLGNTAKLCLPDPGETGEYITKMSMAARELIMSLDQIVWAVDPENDSLENLANYICRYASEFTADSHVHCKFKIPWKLPPCQLSTDVRHNAFLAVKEALNNAIKHSGATEIVIAITAHPGELEIIIADNGRGMVTNPDQESQKLKRIGRGLAAMRDRLTSIRGKFVLNSQPGLGTEICLVIPLDLKTDPASHVYPN